MWGFDRGRVKEDGSYGWSFAESKGLYKVASSTGVSLANGIKRSSSYKEPSLSGTVAESKGLVGLAAVFDMSRCRFTSY